MWDGNLENEKVRNEDEIAELQQDLDAGHGLDVEALSSFTIGAQQTTGNSTTTAVFNPSAVDSAVVSQFRSMAEVNKFENVGMKGKLTPLQSPNNRKSLM